MNNISALFFPNPDVFADRENAFCKPGSNFQEFLDILTEETWAIMPKPEKWGSMVQYQPLEPVSSNEAVLQQLGRKIGSGMELSMPERLMAMTATAKSTANYYGPGPADMVLQKPELPETVKGVLANYIG